MRRLLAMSSRNRSLRMMYEESDAGNEDVPLWPCTDTEIPLITHSELSPNRLDEKGAFRSKPVNLIVRPGKYRRQFCPPVIAHLP